MDLNKMPSGNDMKSTQSSSDERSLLDQVATQSKEMPSGNDMKSTQSSSDERSLLDQVATQSKEMPSSNVVFQDPKVKNIIDWVFQHEFELDVELWGMMHDEGMLRPVANEYFIKFLNHCVDDIPCVLNKTGGSTLASRFFVLKFKCGHKSCGREYKVEQIGNNTFQVFNNNSEIVHTKKVVRQMRGTQKAIIEMAMSQMLPSEYREFCENSVDKELRKLGNLQECPSDTTLCKIRSAWLQRLDFDKDDVYDILKMKLCADFKRKIDSQKDVYIRRFYLDPFIVIAFSDAGLECLMLLAETLGSIKLHLDATGSIARHVGKILFYYAGVIAAKLNSADKTETARLLPVIEFLSGEHDSMNISIPLSLFKHHFHRKYPNKAWPIQYCVTDFSFALLNAVCHSWNNMLLITYINHTYLYADGVISLKNLKIVGIETFLQLCIAHLSKTHSKDVSKYYPQMDSKSMAILKEIFAGIFDMTSLDAVRKVWKKFSILLLSKFVTEDVQNALESLARVMVKSTATENIDEEMTDVDRKLPNDVHHHESIYEQSLFYQNFKGLTYKAEFGTMTNGPVNKFYCPEYADVFLKKYVSLLSLWTCLTQPERSVNACGECHFKNSKQRLINKSRSIGTMPLKPGRFLREMESYSMATRSAILDEVPRIRCCDQNRQKCDKRKRDDDDENRVQPPKRMSLMDLYKIAPKTSATPKASSIKTPKAINEVDDFIKIDDPNSEEQWNRKRNSKFSYIEKLNLRKINKTDNRTALNKILEKCPSKKPKIGRTLGMKNSLTDNPATYLAPEINYAISGIGKLLLHKNDYETLQRPTVISIPVVKFVFAIFQSEANKIQFETNKTAMIVDGHIGVKRMFKISKDIVIGTLFKDNHFTLVIINSRKRCFSYIDPRIQNPSETTTYFQSFEQFLLSHNKKYNEKIPEENWRIEHLQHQLESDEYDSGLFVLNFAKQYIDSEKIDHNFEPEQYGVYLQHLILQKSKRMLRACVLCGLNLAKRAANNSISHATCTSCNRGTHLECINKVEDDFKDDSLNFFCIICKSNAINTLPEDIQPTADVQN